MIKKQILIVDCGATKSDWSLVEQGKITHRFMSVGISPIFQTTNEIANEIKERVLPQFQSASLSAIYFYGAGCLPEKIEGVKKAIHLSFPIKKIEVYSDLIGAAHSLCGDEPGIACILGTGSNSCEWNGSDVTKQIPPLGYILGDEGSGAYMGKLLVGNALKNLLPQKLKDKFLKQYKLTPSIIIENVYKNPNPNRFLASISPFLLQNIEEDAILQIVKKSFNDFFERNVMQYDFTNKTVHLVGSIAYHYAAILKKAASTKGINLGKIEQSPIEGLVKYYNTKNDWTPND